MSVAPERPTSVWLVYLNAWREDEAVARCVRELGTQLEKAGFAVTIAGLRGDVPRSRGLRAFEQVRFLCSLLATAVRSLRSTDIIITLDAPSGVGLLGAVCRRLSGGRIRHISWVLDLYRFQEQRSSIAYCARRWLELQSLRRSSELVTIGTCMTEKVEELTGKPAETIAIWQDVARFVPHQQPVTRVAQAGAVTALYAGNAGLAHELVTVVDAAQLAQPDDSLAFRIIGHGVAFEEARKLAEARGLTNIAFLAPVTESEIRSELSSATVHLISLRNEATGTCVPSKTYASMAAGKPCLYIGDARGQAARDVVAAAAGTVTPEGDAASLVAVLLEYSRDPPLAEVRGRNGRGFASAHRSAESQGLEWAEFLRLHRRSDGSYGRPRRNAEAATR